VSPPKHVQSINLNTAKALALMAPPDLTSNGGWIIE
jgi:hypothetical protein